jgi:glutathione peroxidase
MSESIYDFECTTITGEKKPMADYKGKVLLIVNTASKCGFTPQLEGLEDLYRDYQAQGLEVLGFPCNQFGNQDPGSNEEIAEFCTMKFNIDFPMFAKLEVNGPDADPMYQYLKKEAPGFLNTKRVKWNFTKFLIARDGTVLKRFAPKDKPEDLKSAIESALG